MTGNKANTVRRRLGAILFADVVGYTRLMGEDELVTHDSVKHRLEKFEAAHSDVIRSLIPISLGH